MNSLTIASHLHLWASMLRKPSGFSHSTSNLCTRLKDIIKLRFKVIHQYCSGNENLLKLPRGDVYDMLIVKTEKKVEVTKPISTIWQVQHAKFPPHMAPSWQVTWTIANLYWIFLTRILLKMSIRMKQTVVVFWGKTKNYITLYLYGIEHCLCFV
jgi:hypothetical protein